MRPRPPRLHACPSSGGCVRWWLFNVSPILSAVRNTPLVEVFTRHNSNVLAVNVDEMDDHSRTDV